MTLTHSVSSDVKNLHFHFITSERLKLTKLPTSRPPISLGAKTAPHSIQANFLSVSDPPQKNLVRVASNFFASVTGMINKEKKNTPKAPSTFLRSKDLPPIENNMVLYGKRINNYEIWYKRFYNTYLKGFVKKNLKKNATKKKLHICKKIKKKLHICKNLKKVVFFGFFFATGLVFDRFLASRSRFFEKVNGLGVFGDMPRDKVDWFNYMLNITDPPTRQPVNPPTREINGLGSGYDIGLAGRPANPRNKYGLGWKKKKLTRNEDMDK
ncbi:hypothetical protein LXL04_027528 [Taraxacum kok-saghyz]